MAARDDRRPVAPGGQGESPEDKQKKIAAYLDLVSQMDRLAEERERQEAKDRGS